MKSILFALLLLAASTAALAQNNIPYTAIYYSPNVGSFYYSGGLGSVGYIGDLGSMFGPRKTHGLLQGLQYNLSAGYQLTNYVSLRLDWHSYKHSSPDYRSADSLTRFTEFKAGRSMDFSINLVHDLTQKANIDAGDRLYSPYVLFGVGITQHKGTLTFDSTEVDYDLFPDVANEEKAMNKMGIILPLGGGIRYYIRHNLNVAFEVRAAVDLSDMFDHVANRVPDTKTRDKYILYGLRLTWSKSYQFNYRFYKKKNYHGL
jgi:hypothetical protein